MLNFFLEYGPVIYFAVVAFVFGAMLGSFMNVIVARLPYEKSVVWPGSRCGNCYQPIRFFFDNVPLFSYLLLRGRCRTCGARFSIRYFLVELFVALAFVGVFVFEIVDNINGVPGLTRARNDLNFKLFSLSNLPYFAFFLHRATLVWLLTAAALCDLEDRSIPLGITLPGMLIGLVFATCFAWPWPSVPAEAMPVLRFGGSDWWLVQPMDMEKGGLYPWPVWGPPPAWAPAGSWQLGLLTGLAGAAAGTFLLRAVKYLAERGLGKEAMGLGDADLMMMVGAFLGWQPVVVAFLLGGVITLFLTLPTLVVRGMKPVPFGPGLALGTAATWLGWHHIAPYAHMLMFNRWLVLIFFGGCGLMTFVLMFLFGAVQGRGELAPAAGGNREPPAPPPTPTSPETASERVP